MNPTLKTAGATYMTKDRKWFYINKKGKMCRKCRPRFHWLGLEARKKLSED